MLWRGGEKLGPSEHPENTEWLPDIKMDFDATVNKTVGSHRVGHDSSDLAATQMEEGDYMLTTSTQTPDWLEPES